MNKYSKKSRPDKNNELEKDVDKVLTNLGEISKEFSAKFTSLMKDLQNQRRVNDVLTSENRILREMIDKFTEATKMSKKEIVQENNSSDDESRKGVELKNCKMELLLLKSRLVESQKKYESQVDALKNLLAENNSFRERETELKLQFATQTCLIERGQEAYKSIFQTNSILNNRIYEMNNELQQVYNENAMLKNVLKERDENFGLELAFLRKRQSEFGEELLTKQKTIDELKGQIYNLLESENIRVTAQYESGLKVLINGECHSTGVTDASVEGTDIQYST